MAEGESKNIPEVTTRTAQHCAQCTAHGQISLLKGHKKICPFKDCACVHCLLVNKKRQIMAKQVKLKRLQEKNHGLKKGRRQRVGKNRSTSKAKETEATESVSPENKIVYPDNSEVSQELNDIQLQYQEEAWRAVCGSELLDNQLKCLTTNQWCPVSPLRFSHVNPLQLPTTPSFLHPRSPSISMATNFFPSTVPDKDILSLNHIQTQPVYYTPPGFAVSLAQDIRLPPFSGESFLPLEVVPMLSNGHPMDAAQTLLTLR